jgi:hypothetical protein
MRTLSLGRETEVVFDEGRSVAAQYQLVPVNEMRTCVTINFQIEPDFPAELQNRSYSGAEGAAARELVEDTDLDPRHVLDTTSFAALGPPVCLPSGLLIAGTHRSLVLRRTVVGDIRRWADYQRCLRAPGGILAFAGIALDGVPPDAALVRVLTEVRSNAEWSQLNALSDEPLSKSFDPLSRAIRAARRLTDDAPSLVYLRNEVRASKSDRPVGQVLSSESGYQFVRHLIRDGVLHRNRLPEANTWTHSRLAATLRREVVDLLYARTLGTMNVVRYLKNFPSVARIVEPALLTLATATGDNAAWLRQTVRDALQYHFDAGLVVDAKADDIPVSMFGSFVARPSSEALEICGWISRVRRASLLGPVLEFLARTTPPILPTPDPLPSFEMFPEMVVVPPIPPRALYDLALFRTVCHETFGAAAPTFLPRTATGLQALLTAFPSQTRERQRVFTQSVLPVRVIERTHKMLTPPVALRRARGRPMLPVDGIVRAVALLRHARVPERHYHRFWRRFPAAWACGTWTTFVSRRREWTRAESSPWDQLCTLLDDASQAAPG